MATGLAPIWIDSDVLLDALSVDVLELLEVLEVPDDPDRDLEGVPDLMPLDVVPPDVMPLDVVEVAARRRLLEDPEEAVVRVEGRSAREVVEEELVVRVVRDDDDGRSVFPVLEERDVLELRCPLLVLERVLERA